MRTTLPASTWVNMRMGRQLGDFGSPLDIGYPKTDHIFDNMPYIHVVCVCVYACVCVCGCVCVCVFFLVVQERFACCLMRICPEVRNCPVFPRQDTNS